MCFAFIPFFFLLPHQPLGATELSALIVFICFSAPSLNKYLLSLLCARHEVRTVGIQQWIKQSLPLRPSSSEEKENRFMKSYNARLNLSSLPPSLFFFPLFVPSCFSLWTMWVCPSFCAWCLESLGKLYVRETMILFFREPEAGESLNNSILVFSSRFLP